jgi:hypothetical protein
MNKPASIRHPLQQGDKVAYYVQRRVSAGHHTTRIEQIRRTGIVQGWRGGKVIVLHKAGYTEDLAEADLYYIE